MPKKQQKLATSIDAFSDMSILIGNFTRRVMGTIADSLANKTDNLY